MEKKDKIFIAGRNGLVGSAIERKFVADGYRNIIGPDLSELDLRIQKDTELFFQAENPDYVVLAAAKVGGINANISYPAEFLYDNLAIQTNVIHSAYKYRVKKLLFLASSCIYPRLSQQPMKEEYVLNGYLEPTNEGYALAKICGLKQCQAYNVQYKTNFISVIPCNVYGIGDNFDLEKSHVVAALIRKFHEAKIERKSKVMLWGTGNARRELLYCDDLADACLFVLKMYNDNQYLNIGTGNDNSILEIAETIKKVVGFCGDTLFDANQPDGMPQKLVDVSRIHQLGWRHKTSLEDGIEKTYQWYLDNHA